MKALLVVTIVLVAAGAGAYYYVSTSKPPTPAPTQLPIEFQLSVAPSFIHISPGWGKNVTVIVARAPNFTSDIHVALSGPSWVMFSPLVIHAPATNGSLYITVEGTAPNGSVNVQVAGLAAGSGIQTTTLGVTVTGVYNISAPSGGTAEVFDTTKVLDNATMADLTSYNNSTGVMQFSAATPALQGLQSGDVIIGAPSISHAAMTGFVRVVIGAQQAGGAMTLQTGQATLFDIFRTAHLGNLGNTTKGSSGSSSSSLSIQNISPSLCLKLSCYTGTYTILPTETVNPSASLPGGFSIGAKLTLGLGASWGIDMNQGIEDVCVGAALAVGYLAGTAPPAAAAVGAACVFLSSLIGKMNFFQMGVDLTEGVDIYFKGSSSGGLTTGQRTILPIMGSAGPVYGYVPIFPPFLWLVVNAGVAASASFNFTQPPDIEWSEQVSGLVFGFWYCNNDYANQGHCANPGSSPQTGWSIQLDPGTISPPTLTTQGFGNLDDFKITLGPSIEVDLDSFVVGIGASIFGFINDPGLGGGGTPGTPTITSPTDGSTINLSNPNFVSPSLFNWNATAPGPTSGEYSCTWYDDKLNPQELGQSSANDCNLDTTPGNAAGLIDRIIAAGPVVHHIKVTAGWTFPSTDVTAGVGVNGQVTFADLALQGFLGPASPLTGMNLGWLGTLSTGDQTIAQTTVFTEPGGGESVTSNPISVTFTLPAPTVQILNPTPGELVTEGTPFFGVGHATIATGMSSTNPDGLIHLCLTKPQNIEWYVGGNFLPGVINAGGGQEGGLWVGSVASGTGCVVPLTIPSTPQQSCGNMPTCLSTYTEKIYMIYTVTLPAGNWYIPQTSSGIPLYYASRTIVVQHKTAPTAPTAPTGAPQLNVKIVSPASGSGPYGYEQVIPLQASVSGGTPPYTSAAWTLTYTGTYSIASGPLATVNPDQWTVSSAACLALDMPNVPETVILQFTVTDSAGVQGMDSVQIILNCAVSQSIQPIPVLGLTLSSLLTVLFAVTAEQPGTRLRFPSTFRGFCAVSFTNPRCQ